MNLVIKCFRICLFIFNLLYFMFGICYMIIAVYLHYNPTALNELIKIDFGENYLQLVRFLVGVSIFSILVSLIGCAGIISKKGWILFIYFGCLFLIFGLQFATAIFFYLKSSIFFKQFKMNMIDLINHKYGISPLHTYAYDALQTKYQCCGWYSPRDWLNSSYLATSLTTLQPSMFRSRQAAVTTSFDEDRYWIHNKTIRLIIPDQKNIAIVYKLPESCCIGSFDNYMYCALKNKYHEIGCESFLQTEYNQLELYLAWIMAFLNMFQLILLILALYLICIVYVDTDSSKIFMKNSAASKYLRDNYYNRMNGDYVTNKSNNKNQSYPILNGYDLNLLKYPSCYTIDADQTAYSYL